MSTTMSTTMSATASDALMRSVPTKKKRRRKGKGARALVNRKKAEGSKALEDAAIQSEKQRIEELRLDLGLKHGDMVQTKPSDLYRASKILTVRNVVHLVRTFYDKRTHDRWTSDDFTITFEENGSNGLRADTHTWGSNFGSTYRKISDASDTASVRASAIAKAKTFVWPRTRGSYYVDDIDIY